MTGTIDAHLAALGIEIPEAPVPVASYAPYVVSGNLVFVAGQVPFVDGELKYVGRVGDTLDVETGHAAARICAPNLIAQVKAACGGDLDRVTRVVKLGAIVACTDDFTQHPQVINGASDLMAEIFGENGKHARVAVGANSLPLGCSVEVDGIFEIA